MKRYKRFFKEEFDIDLFIENFQIKENRSNICATSIESFYNMVNMYKDLERENCKDKRKILKYLKKLLIDFVTIDSMLANTFNYEGIAKKRYRF